MASSRRTGTNEGRWNGSALATDRVNTYDSAGGKDYTSLVTWEQATDIDVGEVSPVIECYSGTHALSAQVSLAGATNTSATYRRIIRAASTARHAGVPTAGVIFTGAIDYGLFVLNEPYAILQDVHIVNATNSANYTGGVVLGNQAGLQVVGCLLKATNAGSAVASGVYAETAFNDFVVVNCIAYECKTNGFSLRGTSSIIYNCTAVGNGNYGFGSTQSTMGTVKNCLAQSNTGGDFRDSTWAGSATCLSSDTTSPTEALRSKTVTFVDADNDDYRITNDADAVGAGTDLSSDPVFAFDDDIAFTTRS